MIELSESLFGSRFDVVRLLGRGGQGIVYEVLDRETGRSLALKVLRDWDADSRAYFKREFRAMQGVRHQSLIRLHDLFEASGHLFFTMDLVAGRHFLTFIRKTDTDNPTLELADTSAARFLLRRGLESSDHDEPIARSNERWHFDEQKLRHALPQLVQSLEVLHANGLVHRDIKPSNILIRDDGTLCLLDFGLVSETQKRESSTNHIAGTVSYMAPEQSAAERVGPAADWYAVGVVLFLALTGRLPFDGSPLDVMVSKRILAAPSPSSFVTGLPEDLVRLCEQLLLRDAVLRIEGVPWRCLLPSPPLPTVSHPAPRTQLTPFLGRSRELGWLLERYQQMVQGGALTVRISGESGIGKSSLLLKFMEQLRDRDARVVVLKGRCYERESIHYKGIDGLVGSLVRFLRSLPSDECSSCIPRHAQELIRQFPAFVAVPAMQRAGQHRTIVDSTIARARGAAALRELLARVGDRFPTVAIIDDAQWIDSDGGLLLQELVRPPDAPRLLLICSYTVRGTLPDPKPDLAHDGVLTVGPLLEKDAETLAREYAGRLGFELSALEANALALEANGHPILLYELVRYASAIGEGAPRAGLRLEDALLERISLLPREVVLVLKLACVSEVPLDREIALSASALDSATFADCAELLVSERLLAGLSSGIQPSHDRVRKAVVSMIEPSELCRLHQCLAEAFERVSPDQVESLATHWSRANSPTMAAPHAALAGRAAAATFAFDRACSFYRVALLGTDEPTTRLALCKALGDVLASAGRSLDAANAFLDAARLCSTELESRNLRRRAAEELLRSGHIDEGTAVLQGVLAPMGIALRTAPRTALASLVYHRARLALRGTAHELNSPDDVPADILQRIDACWSVASGLGLVDMIQGADFQTRGLLLALRAGEPQRLAQGLALEAALLASDGPRANGRVARLLTTAEGLLDRITNPEVQAWLSLARGIVALQHGRFAECLTFSAEAEGILTKQCVGTSWQLARAQIFSTWSLVYLGRLREVRTRVPRLLSDYNERRDVFSQMALKLGPLHLLGLADDEIAEMRRECEVSLARWSQRGFHFQHMSALFTMVAADLYEGRAAAAVQRIDSIWGKVEASQLLRVQFIRIDIWFLRARAGLLFAASAPEQRRVALRVVRRAVRLIEREAMPWSKGMALTLRAGLACFEREASALKLLKDAEAVFLRAGLRLHAASCALQASRLAGQARLMGEDILRSEGVRRPEHFAGALVPMPLLNVQGTPGTPA